jgi:hypothetical protein
VHGPLSLTLMLQAISGHLEAETKGQHVLESIEYRNFAPLYCDEEMRICGVKKGTGDGHVYDVWIEGPTGGMAVKGTVRTTAKQVNKTSVEKSSPSSTVIPKEPPTGQAKDAKTVERKWRRNIFKSPEIHSESPLRNMKPSARMTKALVAKSIVHSVPQTEGLRSTQEDEIAERKAEISTLNSATLHAESWPGNTVRYVPVINPVESRSRNTEPSARISEPLRTFTLPPVHDDKASEAHTPANVTTSSRPSERPTSISEPRRASRRNRFTIRRIAAPPSPFLSRPVPRTQSILRRSFRVSLPPFSVKPVPLVRQYRGKTYRHDPTRVAHRHSRYIREGVRKLDKVVVRSMKS